MKFNACVNKILEDFNIFPRSQNAPSTGPDQGMTTGDINNTFPSKMNSVLIKSVKRKKGKKIKRILTPDLTPR